MKLVITLSILLSSFQAFSCSCVGWNFTYSDRDNAVTNFMSTKRNVKAEDIIRLESEYIDGFLRPADKAIVSVMRLFSDENDPGYQCEVGCMTGANAIFATQVTYNGDNAEVCVQDLRVEMASNMTDEGYSSKVIKNTHPVCN